MRRADRLLNLIQILRRHRLPVTAQRLAEELEVSRRTVYRDVADLQASRVPIDGEAGVGYLLRPGYDLPPLMFSVEEIEAIVLGLRLVVDRGDPALVHAAADVMTKVSAVVPSQLASAIQRSALLVPARAPEAADFGRNLHELRLAVRDQQKLKISYTDEAGRPTERLVWPLAIFLYTHVTLLCAWCELRADYRMFRSDRIHDLGPTGERFDGRNGNLLKDYLSRPERAQLDYTGPALFPA
jgi:predicted DNA-binding transcriptional regulator YafY